MTLLSGIDRCKIPQKDTNSCWYQWLWNHLLFGQSDTVRSANEDKQVRDIPACPVYGNIFPGWRSLIGDYGPLRETDLICVLGIDKVLISPLWLRRLACRSYKAQHSDIYWDTQTDFIICCTHIVRRWRSAYHSKTGLSINWFTIAQFTVSENLEKV